MDLTVVTLHQTNMPKCERRKSSIIVCLHIYAPAFPHLERFAPWKMSMYVHLVFVILSLVLLFRRELKMLARPSLGAKS